MHILNACWKKVRSVGAAQDELDGGGRKAVTLETNNLSDSWFVQPKEELESVNGVGPK